MGCFHMHTITTKLMYYWSFCRGRYLVPMIILLLTIWLTGCSSLSAWKIPFVFHPTATPQPTELEALDAEMRTNFGTLDSRCGTCEPLPGGANCSQYLWTKPITRPEWTQLFPIAHFYIVGFKDIENMASNPNGYELDNILIAMQDDQRYTFRTFDQLLNANHITISDENRELVARAYALMTLANYVEDSVTFENWEPANVDRYNYALTAWTRIGGLQFEWLYQFYGGCLAKVDGSASVHKVGNYIEVQALRWPTSDDFRFYWSVACQPVH